MPKEYIIYYGALKRAVTMEQILTLYGLRDQFTMSKMSEDILTGPCPISKGAHRSHPTQFRISISKNAWRCFSDCHSQGNILDFVAKMEKVDENEAANLLVEWFKLDVKKLNAAEEKQAALRQDLERETKTPIP